MGTTKKDLLEDLWRKPYSLARTTILRRAERGYYHDFDSPLATPKVQLVTELRAAGFEDLAQKTIDGAYDDEQPTLAQKEELRLLATQFFGDGFYDEIMGEKGRGKA